MDLLTSRAIIGEFYARLEASPGMEWINGISMLFQSDQAAEEYAWLGMSPLMREWVGGRQAQGLTERSVTIRNKHFEGTLEVETKDLRRDKSGQILVRVRELADSANLHWAELLSTTILAAGATVCYDGQYFFDTDHSEGQSGTQSNSIQVDISTLAVATHGSTTLPSVPEMQMSILAGIQQILGFKDDRGRPMNEMARKFIVMVPTALWHVAEAAVNNPVLVSGETNLLANLRGRIEIAIAVNPRLTWTDKFAIFRADGNVKPLIRQEETKLQMAAVAEGSELEFKEKKHWYGVDTWRNTGLGYWQHGCLVQMV